MTRPGDRAAADLTALVPHRPDDDPGAKAQLVAPNTHHCLEELWFPEDPYPRNARAAFHP
jgi:hypothetical protein